MLYNKHRYFNDFPTLSYGYKKCKFIFGNHVYKFLPVHSSWQFQSNHDNWACGGFMYVFVYLDDSVVKCKPIFNMCTRHLMNKLNMSLALNNHSDVPCIVITCGFRHTHR